MIEAHLFVCSSTFLTTGNFNLVLIAFLRLAMSSFSCTKEFESWQDFLEAFALGFLPRTSCTHLCCESQNGLHVSGTRHNVFRSSFFSWGSDWKRRDSPFVSWNFHFHFHWKREILWLCWMWNSLSWYFPIQSTTVKSCRTCCLFMLYWFTQESGHGRKRWPANSNSEMGWAVLLK